MEKSEKKDLKKNLSQNNNANDKGIKKTSDSKKEETLDEKLKNNQEKLLRTMAEMENQRRRFEKEKEEAFEFGGFNFARETLSLLDNIDRAIDSFKNDENLKGNKDLNKIIDGIEEDTAKELIERAEEFYKKDQMEINNKIKDLGLESELINHEGLTPGMLVTLGEQSILKLSDFADLASDELTGAFDIVKGERVKIKGYLEDFALSKKEADELIMSAREKIYKD